MVPFPPDDYMRLLAEALYSVAYLEWAILGDLPRLYESPAGLSIERLSRSSMGPVAGEVRKAASHTADPDERAWLNVAADALEAVVEKRNQVVHSHPAMIHGEQILYRWAVARDSKPHEAHAITREQLIELRDLAHEYLRQISTVRLES